MTKKLLFVLVVLAIVLSVLVSVFGTPVQSSNIEHTDTYVVKSSSGVVTWLLLKPTKDTSLSEASPDLNLGSNPSLYLQGNGLWNNRHSRYNIALEFNLNAIPQNAVITSATLSLYLHSCDEYDVAASIGCGRQHRPDWVENEATFNVYKTGSSWTLAGGDWLNDGLSGLEELNPSYRGWIDIDVKDIVQDSLDLSIPAEFLIRAVMSETHYQFWSREGDSWLSPKLEIEYTTDGSSTPTPTPTPTPAPTTPVILVHGWASSPSEWADMIAFLEGNGYERDVNLFAIDLNPHGIAWGPINWYAGDLAAFISEKAGANKVDLVCHSMGGLVSRWYTRFGYSSNVRNLIMIGTPNHGTPLAALGADILGPLGIIAGGVAGAQMIPYSPFLNELNYGNPLFYSGIDIVNPATHHETIAGTVGWWYTWLFFLWNTNDGVVAEESVRLDGVNLQEVPYNHTAQINENETFQMVLDILQGDTAYASVAVQQNSALVQAEHDNSIPQQTAVQLAPMISGKIFSVEQKSHEIPISATSNATFALAWLSGDLDLTLTTPSGTTIDPSVAEGNVNISYYQDGNTTIEGYTVINPEIGIWQVNIAAVNVSAEGEDYTVLTFLETTLHLSSKLAKYQYDPGEQISIVAELKNDGTPLTGASVSTEIQRPDESVESLALYDDGLHCDEEANDGIYANAYANTTTSGMYKITIFANGLVNNQEFARQAIAAVWAEYYPDLTLASSDISFSDDAPLVVGNVTISAIISNIGEANAGNVSILFFDGVPADDVLIGEDVIDVNAGKTANASVSCNITVGQHEIHVVVSPFNSFLEKDYINNEAYKIINVTPSTTTYTFTSGGGTNKWCWEGDVRLIDWNNGHPASPDDFANSYGYVAGSTSAYSAVSSSDNVHWRSSISRCLGCCAFDRNAELFTFKITEDPATISNIQIKWEGHGTTGEIIYYTTEKLWNASSNSWSTLNNQRNITGDVTWTDSISSNCSNYIDALGNLSLLIASQRSGLPKNCGIWTDYVEVTIIHK